MGSQTAYISTSTSFLEVRVNSMNTFLYLSHIWILKYREKFSEVCSNKGKRYETNPGFSIHNIMTIQITSINRIWKILHIESTVFHSVMPKGSLKYKLFLRKSVCDCVFVVKMLEVEWNCTRKSYSLYTATSKNTFNEWNEEHCVVLLQQ